MPFRKAAFHGFMWSAEDSQQLNTGSLLNGKISEAVKMHGSLGMEEGMLVF